MISSRPPPVPLRSVSPLSSPSLSVSSLSAPTVDLQQTSAALSESCVLVPLRLSQLAQLSPMLLHSQSSVQAASGIAFSVFAVSGEADRNASGSETLCSTIGEADSVESTVMLPTLSAVPISSTVSTLPHASSSPQTMLALEDPSITRPSSAAVSASHCSEESHSADESLLVIYATRVSTVACRSVSPIREDLHQTQLEHLVQWHSARLLATYFVRLRVAHRLHTERAEAACCAHRHSLLRRAFDTMCAVHEQREHDKTLLIWAWGTMRRQLDLSGRFQQCRLLSEYVLLSRVFAQLTAGVRLAASTAATADAFYRARLVSRVLHAGLIGRYSALLAHQERAQAHYHTALHYYALRALHTRAVQLRACAAECAALHRQCLLKTGLRSLCRVHTVMVWLQLRREAFLVRKYFDHWQCAFLKRLRAYTGYGIISRRRSLGCLRRATAAWREQASLSAAFHRWHTLHRARVLVRTYAGTSTFRCLEPEEPGYTSTYRGVHPRVETIFKGAFVYLRDRARLLRAKEKIIALLFKRRAFEALLVAYCRCEAERVALAAQKGTSADANVCTEEISGASAADTKHADASTCTRSMRGTLHDNEVAFDQATEEQAHTVAELGVQTSIAEKPSMEQARPASPHPTQGRMKASPARRDCIYTTLELQTLDARLTHSPTTVRQIIRKYRAPVASPGLHKSVRCIVEQTPASDDQSGPTEDTESVCCLFATVHSALLGPQPDDICADPPTLRQVARVCDAALTHAVPIVATAPQRFTRMRTAASSPSNSTAEISSVALEEHPALRMDLSPQRSGQRSPPSAVSSPFSFMRELPALPEVLYIPNLVPTVPVQQAAHSPHRALLPKDLARYEDCDGYKSCADHSTTPGASRGDGPPLSQAPSTCSMLTDEPSSDAFRKMQIITFTVRQPSDTGAVASAVYQASASASPPPRQTYAGTAIHPEAGAYRMLDVQYRLVSSYTESIREATDTSCAALSAN